MRTLVKVLLAALPLIGAAQTTMADQSVTGKILSTQGHITLACRTLILKEASGAQHAFRIANTNGAPDHIAAVALAAVVSQLDVSITFDPVQTTGCGGEPMILYITIWSGI